MTQYQLQHSTKVLPNENFKWKLVCSKWQPCICCSLPATFSSRGRGRTEPHKLIWGSLNFLTLTKHFKVMTHKTEGQRALLPESQVEEIKWVTGCMRMKTHKYANQKAMNTNGTNGKDREPQKCQNLSLSLTDCRLNLFIYECACLYFVCLCVCKKKRAGEMALSGRDTLRIICQIRYSTGHEYQRERRERERCRQSARHHNKSYLPYHTIC